MENNCPISPYLKELFDKLDNSEKNLNYLDDHIKTEIPKELYDEIIFDYIKILRNRGLEKNDIKLTLNKLQKSKKDYISDIKRSISQLNGFDKEKSIKKRNRRSIDGIKGKMKNNSALNVILDVSGSMCGYFETALSYIFQNKIVINLILCDTEIKKQTNNSYLVIKNKHDFKKIEINGLGGTTLQPAIDFIVETKQINKLNTLILTDGATDKLDVSKLKKTLIISIGEKCPIKNGNPRQICIT
jgi:predicted metal-dependent peptidase